MKMVSANSRGRRVAACTLAFCLSSLILASCGFTPITQGAVLRAKDSTLPVITIVAPMDGETCANIVEVKGKATDHVNDGSPGQVARLEYAVLGTAIAGTAELDGDGNYHFLFDASATGSAFTLNLTAADWNGNIASSSLALKRDLENGIPSLKVAASNRRLTLSWDPVPHVTAYTLRYTNNGSLPSESNGSSISIPAGASTYTLAGDPDGVANGHRYNLRLYAHPDSGWPSCVSDFVQGTALAPSSLAPYAEGGKGEIRLRWQGIRDADGYEVWRKTEAASFSLVATGLTACVWTDTGVSPGVWYSYSIKPVGTDASQLSEPATAQCHDFDLATYPEEYSLRTLNASSIVVGGSLAVTVSSSSLTVLDISVPSRPIPVGSMAMDDPMMGEGGYIRICDMALDPSEDFVYIGYSVNDSLHRLAVVDVRNPARPTLSLVPDASNFGFGRDIAIDPDKKRLFTRVGNGRDICVFDISPPGQPRFIDYNEYRNGTSIDNTYGISFDPVRRALWTVGYNGAIVRIAFDDSTGTLLRQNPILVADTRSPSQQPYFTMRDDVAVVSCWNGTQVYAMDASWASTTTALVPVPAGVSFTGAVANPSIAGGRILIPTGRSLVEVNVSNKEAPVLSQTVAGVSAMSAASSLDGKYVYVCEGVLGLRVLSSKEPARAGILGSLALDSKPLITRQAGFLHFSVAQGGGGYELRVYDTSESSPVLRSVSSIGTIKPLDLAFSGTTLFLLLPGAGIDVWDLGDPASPARIGRSAGLDSLNGMEIEAEGPMLYLLASGGLLLVFDASEVLAPRLIGTGVCMTSNGRNLAVAGTRAFTSEDWNPATISEYDCSSPKTGIPRKEYASQVDQLGTQGDHALVVKGRHIEWRSEDKIGTSQIFIYDTARPAAGLKMFLDVPSPVFSAFDDLLYSANGGFVSIWNIQTGTPSLIGRFDLGAAAAGGIDGLYPEGRRLVVLARDAGNVVRLLQVELVP